MLKQLATGVDDKLFITILFTTYTTQGISTAQHVLWSEAPWSECLVVASTLFFWPSQLTQGLQPGATVFWLPMYQHKWQYNYLCAVWFKFRCIMLVMTPVIDWIGTNACWCLCNVCFRYNTAPMPEKGNVMRFWMNVSRPIARKMGFVFVLQGFFGTFLASKHFDIYLKLLKLVDIDHEDLHD